MNELDKQILKYLFEGKTAKEIGKLVFRSSRTVEFRLGKIREEYNCKNNIQLVVKLSKELIITLYP